MAIRSAVCLVVVVALGTSAAASARTKLPPETLRGPEHELQEYPTVSLATPKQRAAAQRLIAQMRRAPKAWPTLAAAEAAGFDTHKARRRFGDLTVHYLHAEQRAAQRPNDYLNPRRPKALIYANIPGRPLVLVGLMFAVPRGVHGPTPGGPITRWHTHRVCARGGKRGLAPRPDGTCPPGSVSRQGSEMLHAWLTRDLRSAYAIHGPARELGIAGLLPAAFCPR